ncbi:MAG: integrase [Spongiibacteraceae bacterium]|nr:integrase [Spongiibacteraceae bacterium]|tara:strand:+ start:194 stop:1138 length:945 start_codon:yes stop_codon:yes gene_type:complete
MGSITKHPAGGWRAWITVSGKRRSKLFKRKAEAQEWIAASEKQQDAGHSWFDALHRYEKTVLPKRKATTKRWELLRLPKLREQIPDRPLSEVTPDVIASWRDDRLQSVSAGSVLREMSLVGSILSIALKEWRWIGENPMASVSKPSAPPGRDRLITEAEIEKECLALGYIEGKPESVSQRVAVAFLFAIETGMRCGEICGIRPEDINGRVAHLPMTKNGTARNVPLSKEAVRLLKLVGGNFDLKPSQIDALFRKARKAAGLSGFTFHDSRHLASTRLARKLSPLELARMMGHKDLKMVMRYFNETAEEIAKRLD